MIYVILGWYILGLIGSFWLFDWEIHWVTLLASPLIALFGPSVLIAAILEYFSGKHYAARERIHRLARQEAEAQANDELWHASYGCKGMPRGSDRRA